MWVPLTMRYILMLLAVVPLAVGCSSAARGTEVHASQRVRPSARMLTYEEVVELGQARCRSSGYVCELKEAYRPRASVWRLRFAASTETAAGPVQFEFHAYTQELLRTTEWLAERKQGFRVDGFAGEHRGQGAARGGGHAH